MHTEVDANEGCRSLVIGNYFRLVPALVLATLSPSNRRARAQVLLEVQVFL